MFKIADAHSDFLAYSVAGEDSGLYDHAGIERMLTGGVKLQVFAVWVPPEVKDKLSCGQSQINYYHAYLLRNHNWMSACTQKEHIEKDTIQTILSLEGAEVIACDHRLIPQVYRQGVRMMSLTWNDENAFASGVGAVGGIKPQGCAALHQLNALHIALDLSHINEQGFWEALGIYTLAPCASHSCVYDICAAPRNLKRDQIDALIARGGYIGVNFYTQFLSGSDNAGIDAVLDHIDYILDRGGENAVGFGSDFCGVAHTPTGLNTVADFQRLPQAMIKRGYSDDLINKICYGNFASYILEFL